MMISFTSPVSEIFRSRDSRSTDKSNARRLFSSRTPLTRCTRRRSAPAAIRRGITDMRLALCFDTEPVLGTADGSPREPGLLGLSLYVLHGSGTRRQRIAQE